MIIGHSRPPDIAWTVNGTGAAINTDDPSDLTDGRPDSVVEFTWVSGVQNTSTVMQIRAAWADGIVPGIVGISNIDLPVGTKIEVAFHRSGDSGGTYPYSGIPYVTSQRIVEGPRGERTAWFLFQATTEVIGAQITIYNDVNGVASVIASQLFTIGEIFIGAASDVCVGNAASIDNIDPTVQQFSWNSQPYATAGTPYRQLNFKLRTAIETEWFSTYLPLLGKIDRGQFGAFVLSWTDSSGNFNATKLHAYALIGLAKTQPTRTHVARAFYESGQIQVVEAPIPT